nr:cytochrome c biogenesis CcdA family protein [Corynebacterium mendelii]
MLLADGSLGQILSNAVSQGTLIAGLAAAACAGLLSFASPCVVPLVPGYLSYLAGIVGGEMDYDSGQPRVARRHRWRVAGAAALFVLGFTVVFLLATVTFFGAISIINVGATFMQRVGGVVTIIMGLAFMGLVPGLSREHRLHPKRWSTWIGAPLLGGVFALGWTPCLGPTLAAIISVAAGTEGMTALKGAILIFAYCMGLGLPFIVLALGSARAVRAVGFLRRHTRAIQLMGGILLVVVGIALLTGYWAHCVGVLREWSFSSDYAIV